MRVTEFNRRLQWADQKGLWCFTAAQLQLMTGNEVERSLLKSIAAMVKAGLLSRVAKGLYVNPNARSLPNDVLRGLVPYLRPLKLNYISLESALYAADRLSQLPGRLTVMTTGRTGLFETPYGTIEFVHTERKPEGDWLQADPDVPTAPVDVALRDMNRTGRDAEILPPPEPVPADDQESEAPSP